MSNKMPARFTNEDAARAYLETIQWPDGPICPKCGVVNDASPLKGGRKGLYFCKSCREQFTVTVGTVMERSKVPINLWLLANHLLCSSKKGISSHQLARTLGLSYKTAWFLAHRIRLAMAPVAGSEPPLGGPGKVVEADETYIGNASGKARNPGSGHKMKVLSLVERGGKIRSFRIGAARIEEIVPTIRVNVHPETTLHTDGAQVYRAVRTLHDHETVDHNKEYVRPGKTFKIHTNTLEGFFSVFKRGMVGTYQHCGEQHLDRYLAEFDFRQNTRAKLGIDDAMRADKALQGIRGKRLTYRRTNAAQDIEATGSRALMVP